jgi:hypothetical protein
MAGQRTAIIANDYNVIQSKLSQVLGTGSGDFGYGQTVTSSQSIPQIPITAAKWNLLRDDLLKARQHQSGADESGNIPILTHASVIAEAYRSSINSMADLVTTNRLVIPPSNQATRDTILTSVRTTPWNNTLTHTVTVNFSSTAAARYFFNTGSSLDISASRTGGTVGLKNSSWTTMLTNMGRISLRHSNSAVSGTGTVSSSIGWTDLTTVDQLLFVKYTETPTYTPNQYDIYVKSGVDTAQIIFTITFADLSGYIPDPPEGIDENINGTLTSIIEVYRASGNNVSVTSPSALGALSGGAVVPVYHVSPNVTTVNEGGSVVFTVSTSDVPDNTTLYWTTSNTMTTSDFADNVLTGTVIIVNDIGTITRTVRNDYTTEGGETFILSIRTGSTSGTIVANSAAVVINDTSIETYQVTASTSAVNEGSSVVFTVTTQGVPNGTTLYWSNSGNTSAADFTDSAISGSFVINSNSGSITRTLTNDYLTDPGQTVQLQIRTGSTSGPVKVTSSSVAVNDTSVETYQITPDVSSVSEGGSVNFTISTVGVPNNTTLYWDTSGSSSAYDFTSGTLYGTVLINANTGSITRTLVNDGLSEPAEPFTINLRTGSTAGPIKATSSVVTITANGSLTFLSTSQWTAPAGTYQIQFSVTGGRGGQGGSDVVAGHVGFNGSTVTGTASVIPGTVYDMIVGAIGGNGANGTGSGGGAGAAAGLAGYAGGRGGNAGSYYKSNSGGGGGGGAPSWIRSTGGSVLVVAGGGGGGGGAGRQGGAGTQTGGTSGSGTGGQGGTGGFDGGGGGGGGGGYPLGGAGGPITAQDYTGYSGANGQSTGGSVAAPGNNSTANIVISW